MKPIHWHSVMFTDSTECGIKGINGGWVARVLFTNALRLVTCRRCLASPLMPARYRKKMKP